VTDAQRRTREQFLANLEDARKLGLVARRAGGVVELFDDPIAGACPSCGAVEAICKLPPVLLSKQTDGTTHVCNPAHGGCNQGFSMDPVPSGR